MFLSYPNEDRDIIFIRAVAIMIRLLEIDR